MVAQNYYGLIFDDPWDLSASNNSSPVQQRFDDEVCDKREEEDRGKRQRVDLGTTNHAAHSEQLKLVLETVKAYRERPRGATSGKSSWWDEFVKRDKLNGERKKEREKQRLLQEQAVKREEERKKKEREKQRLLQEEQAVKREEEERKEAEVMMEIRGKARLELLASTKETQRRLEENLLNVPAQFDDLDDVTGSNDSLMRGLDLNSL